MTILLSKIDEIIELRVDEVAPVRANVKYSQVCADEMAPVRANVKYSQRCLEETEVVA